MRRALLLVSAIAVLLAAAPRAEALPAYSRLFQGKYGYRITCQLCHSQGGGSAVNDYGRDYLRAGANLGAFAKLEKKDSDGDGSKNLDEIKAKTNPGDARNTSDWLATADKPDVPDVDLKKLFPSADAFAALEGSLKSTQISAVEQRVGASLTAEDKVPTFYFAMKGGKRFAVAEFVPIQVPAGLIQLAVAMDPSGTVSGIRILKNPANKAIEAPAFLDQFKGKKPGDPLAIGKDLKAAAGAEALSGEVALAARKAIAIIKAVFGR